MRYRAGAQAGFGPLRTPADDEAAAQLVEMNFDDLPGD
jgi:hypothetical protein